MSPIAKKARLSWVLIPEQFGDSAEGPLPLFGTVKLSEVRLLPNELRGTEHRRIMSIGNRLCGGSAKEKKTTFSERKTLSERKI